MFNLQLLLGAALSFSGLSLAAPAAANCTREFLVGAVNGYIAAQTAGSSASLRSVPDTVTYTENDKTATLKSGILASALKIDHSRSEYDTTLCATYTELIVTNSAKPYVIGTQMHFTDGVATKIQTLVTTKGDWLFNVTGTMYWSSKEDWGEIPEAKRDTRAVIQAAADSYLNIFKDKTVVVPWGTPCARLEGGSYTGKGSPTDSCNVGIPNGQDLTDRRYVIDETIGAVDVFLKFGSANGLPDSHQFRVEGGKLRFVHTLTVMTK